MRVCVVGRRVVVVKYSSSHEAWTHLWRPRGSLAERRNQEKSGLHLGGREIM
jgi:hypothetical protein